MNTSYSYKIIDTKRDVNSIILNVLAEWTATKTINVGIGTTTVAVSHMNRVALKPPGDDPIRFTSLGESTVTGWYSDLIKEKNRVGIGTTITDDTITVEQNMKNQLDFKMEQQESARNTGIGTFATYTGVPW